MAKVGLRGTGWVAAALSVAVLLTGCGGEEGGKGGESAASGKAKGDGESAASEKVKGEAKAEEKPVALPPLDKAGLDKIVVRGEAGGFKVKTMPEDQPEGAGSVIAGDWKCQGAAGTVGSELPQIQKSAGVTYRSLDPASLQGDTAGSMWLTSYAEDDAKSALAEVRTSLQDCDSTFESWPSTYKSLKELKVPKLGDESLAFTLIRSYDGESMPLSYLIVRSGGVLTAYETYDLVDEGTPDIPVRLAKAQADRLAKAAG